MSARTALISVGGGSVKSRSTAGHNIKGVGRAGAARPKAPFICFRGRLHAFSRECWANTARSKHCHSIWRTGRLAGPTV